MDRTLTLLASAFLLVIGHSAAFAAEEPVDFAREILPVLSDKCFVCHGPDTRKKDFLRLDSFDGATRDLGGYKAIDTSALANSEIITRINDADDPMPPEDAEKQLTADELRTMRNQVETNDVYSLGEHQISAKTIDEFGHLFSILCRFYAHHA